MRINLHCHSIHSDGTLTIENLVSFIKENKIDYFSLTDHDVISGYKELEKYDLTGTTLINGVEMTCFYDRYFFHILGLNINLDKFQTYITK
jgi:predicted metal-dependent phosphoesterase TrpH